MNVIKMAMDISEFTSSIVGEIRYGYNGSYAYFHPHDLPFEFELSPQNRRLSMDVILSMGNLNGRVAGMTEEERGIFLSTFSLKESVHSSSIEGTRSTLSDMFRSEKEPTDPVIKRDVREVRNYMDAMGYGAEQLSEGGEITPQLLHQMHRILLDGTRGENKSPGEFKIEQNAIGIPGDTLDTAKMVPAAPEEVEHLIDNLMEYIASDEDPMVKTAIAHYQFEAIHPYRDGNGRIGRLLIMLILAKEGILTYPAIYPSEYFDRNRDRYIDGLFAVSSKDQLNEWIGFFLSALKEQADRSIRMIDSLRAYRRQLEGKYDNTQKRKVIGMLFTNPYIRIQDVVSGCEVSNPTAAKVISELEKDGVLREVSGRKRNLLFVADGVLDILMSR